MADRNEEMLAARDRLKADGVRFVQIEVTELDGGSRGKLVPIDKGLGGDVGFSTVLYGLSTADDVYESPFTSYENGFLDFFARPDPATIRRLSWRPDTVSVICDFFDADGTMTPECPRTALRRVVERAEAMGFEPRFAVEFEAFVFHVDDALLGTGREDELKPFTRTWNAYSLVRMPELRPLFETFLTRMAETGEPAESTHSEIGFGAVEFAMAHAPALEAADRAMRAKTYFKELCAERGLIATFMAKLRGGQPGAGGHVHQSLWRDGRNAFWQDGALSNVARQYAAGQLVVLPDITALSMPNINSYRRMDWHQWVPENASWGHDNRSCALRLVTHPGEKAVRFENRLPGADANAYLSIAGMLAGGLHGIEQGLEPPPISEGNAALDAQYKRLPQSLEEATQALKESAFARAWLGERFVDHYVLSREAELRMWHEWQDGRVTEWELKRYFETI